MTTSRSASSIAQTTGLSLLALTAVAAQGASNDDEAFAVLPTLHVSASHTATTEPAATYGAPVSRLELNPQIDLQARNLAEAQGDVTIRGGIFENTGFRVGAATLMDPQTGHYFAEIPIAPEMLRGPDVLVGAENALYGFNSSVGTVGFEWTEILDGGSASAGFGDHDLNYQRLHHAQTFGLNPAVDSIWGAEFEASRSESDGTIENGDHNFARFSGRLQRRDADSQTDLFAGYQSKYLAWPELYAAPYGSNESDSVRTTLLMLNHRTGYGEDSSYEATAYYREHHDHYLFNRFSNSLAFLHETQVAAAAMAGTHRFSDRYALAYSAQFTKDEIESTQLENNFTSRAYTKLAVLPEFTFAGSSDAALVLRAGASFDDSNRNSSRFSPMADLTWEQQNSRGAERFYVSYAEATQVPGYTAVGGSSSGLFASNPHLDRELSRNLELGAVLERGEWSLRTAAFYRQDEDLVDWTFSFNSPNARAADNVDIDTVGFEAIASRRFAQLELLGGAAFLDKSEDYGSAHIDASFYALNYAEQRYTLAAIWTPLERVQVRLDNEYREQRANLLREGSDSAFFTHVGVSFFIPGYDQLELRFAVENLWKDDFQEVPGTPGRGRQTSLGATWRW